MKDIDRYKDKERRKNFLILYRQNNKKKNSEYFKKWYTVSGKEYKRDPLKSKARSAFNWAIRSGKIERLPCEVCGEKKSEGHHKDYNKPFDVIWLCSDHHKKHHVFLRESL